MADLSDLEKRLNQDDKLRNDFLSDPVKVLGDEGIQLSPEMERKLRDLTRQTQGGKPPVAGSTLGGGQVAPQDRSIEISISKDI